MKCVSVLKGFKYFGTAGLIFIAINSAKADEKLTVAAFADFSECRHSFSDKCLLSLHNFPNIDISIKQTSINPTAWDGKIARDNSFMGLDAIVEIEAHKDLDPRVDPRVHHWIRARVIKKSGQALIPWVNIAWYGNEMFNGLNVQGPSFADVDADLFRADLFLYLGQPFVPASRR